MDKNIIKKLAITGRLFYEEFEKGEPTGTPDEFFITRKKFYHIGGGVVITVIERFAFISGIPFQKNFTKHHIKLISTNITYVIEK